MDLPGLTPIDYYPPGRGAGHFLRNINMAETLNEYLIRQLTGVNDSIQKSARYAQMLTEEMINSIKNADSPARGESKWEIKPHARVLSEDERKALGEVRAACVRKAAADGSKEILLFLQEHGARSVFDLDSKFYPDLLKICDVKEEG